MTTPPDKHEIWVLSFEYPTLIEALGAYEESRDIIFSDDVDIDASVYRAYVEGTPQVIIIGFGLISPALRQRFGIACAFGTPASTPMEILAILIARHMGQRSLGAKVERRAWEPPRIDPL